jgi:hypothetical protein
MNFEGKKALLGVSQKNSMKAKPSLLLDMACLL